MFILASRWLGWKYRRTLWAEYTNNVQQQHERGPLAAATAGEYSNRQTRAQTTQSEQQLSPVTLADRATTDLDIVANALRLVLSVSIVRFNVSRAVH